MKSLFLILFANLCSISVTAEESWCYEVQVCGSHCKGPKEWHQVNAACGDSSQSPINVVTKNLSHDLSLKPFEFIEYNKKYTVNITNNGHSVQIDLPSEIEILGGGLSGTFTAKQLHFHWGTDNVTGSEHTIDGERFPMELHIVHGETSGRSDSSSSGGLAVLGFFYEETEKANTNYTDIIEALKSIARPGNKKTIPLTLENLIPEKKALELYYRYKGSLTTPPCSETVTWTLFPETIKLSKDQLYNEVSRGPEITKTFSIMPHPPAMTTATPPKTKMSLFANMKCWEIKAFYNNLHFSNETDNPMKENFRPLQKLNGRQVYTSGTGAVLSQCTLLAMSLSMSYLFISS